MHRQLLCFAAMTLAGCGGSLISVGPEQHEAPTIERDKSERVRVELKMPVGELDVRGGSDKLLDGDIIFNVAAWKPDVRYHSAGGVGDLAIEQHGPTSSTGNAKNRWDLRFNDAIPIDLRVEFGAGEGRLNLGSLNLRRVGLVRGVGTLRMDLRGSPKNDYSVRIRGGVGEATVYLPKDVGLSATASGGIGDISVTGLRKEGDRYINDAFGRAAVKVRVDVQVGVGSIKLIAE